MVEAVTAEAPNLGKPRILRQDWLNLSFLHWAVEPASIASFYPPGTEPDVFEGRGYVGLVPFQMANTGLARGPVLLRTFLETNVRLYSVDRTGRRGVVFLSLDTNRRRRGGRGQGGVRSAVPLGAHELSASGPGVTATRQPCAGHAWPRRAGSRCR